MEHQLLPLRYLLAKQQHLKSASCSRLRRHKVIKYAKVFLQETLTYMIVMPKYPELFVCKLFPDRLEEKQQRSRIGFQ